MIWANGNAESWLSFLLVASVAAWPVMVGLGMTWGRMQRDDEIARDERRKNA